MLHRPETFNFIVLTLSLEEFEANESEFQWKDKTPKTRWKQIKSNHQHISRESEPLTNNNTWRAVVAKKRDNCSLKHDYSDEQRCKQKKTPSASLCWKRGFWLELRSRKPWRKKQKSPFLDRFQMPPPKACTFKLVVDLKNLNWEVRWATFPSGKTNSKIVSK